MEQLPSFLDLFRPARWFFQREESNKTERMLCQYPETSQLIMICVQNPHEADIGGVMMSSIAMLRAGTLVANSDRGS